MVPIRLLELLNPNAESLTVIPAKAGIQALRCLLDPGFRRGDDACLCDSPVVIDSEVVLSRDLSAIAAHGQTFGSHPGRAGGLPFFG